MKQRELQEKMAEQPTDVDGTTTGYEVPMVYRVCYACGYNEKVDVKGEDTPAMTKYCPDCGHILNRLSGTELFHLSFSDDKNVLPANMEPVAELPSRNIAPAPLIVPPADIALVKAEGKVFTFKGRNLKSRLERRYRNNNFESMRHAISKSELLEVDGVPVKRYGVFGLSEGNFIDKVMGYLPVTLKEMKEHKISYVNENDYKLRIRIDEDIVEFEPREGFPFFTKQVANTVFEDFIRQAKNLVHEPHRLLAFAMANGVPVHTESVQKEDKYPVRVKPTNFRTFKLLASVLDKKGIFWRGDYNYMKVKSEKPIVEAIAQKIDPYMLVSEETVSGDVSPGYVVKDKKRAKKVQKWLTGMLKGKVTEMSTNAKGNFKFKLMQAESQEYANRLNVVKTMLGDLTGKFHWDNGYIYESGLTLGQIYLGEQEEEGVDTSFEFEAFFPEDIDEDKLELLQDEYAYFKEMLPEWAEIFDVEDYEIPDKVNEFLGILQDIITKTEEESGEPITPEMFTAILEDYKDSEEDVAQFVQYVMGREVPDYVSLYILSDALAIPFLPVEGWYNEFIGVESTETEISPDDIESEGLESGVEDSEE